MELWIRSQDKEDLQKVEHLGVYDKKIYINGYEEHGYCIGEYKTKERALEVLDEIHQRLIDIQLFEHMIGDTDVRWLHKRAIDCVYIMPKE